PRASEALAMGPRGAGRFGGGVMSDPLPLAEAGRRLRRPPGRPRTRPSGGPAEPKGSPSDRGGPLGGRRSAAAGGAPTPGPAPVRLLTLAGAGAYLGVSPDTLEGWVRAGLLRPVPMPARVRRFDRADLDALIVSWKQGG